MLLTKTPLDCLGHEQSRVTKNESDQQETIHLTVGQISTTPLNYKQSATIVEKVKIYNMSHTQQCQHRKK
jgi:hypothetical protein